MEKRTVIANNIKRLWEASDFTQDIVVIYLGIKRSAHSNYGSGARKIPFV